MMTDTQPGLRKIDMLLLAIILALGIFLRLPPHAFFPEGPLQSLVAIHPQPAHTEFGFDEGLYRDYLNILIDGGLGAYPQIVEHYIELQEKVQRSVLPPVRFLYIFCGYSWHQIFGSDALNALRNVAAFFSMLTLALATVFTWRLKGLGWALAIAALMAVAPTQIHMSQHALIDGFFTFWALLSLWLLWENLRAPFQILGFRNWGWLVAYVAALALLVLTKENSFFVWIAFIALLVANRWLKFGTVTRDLVFATFLGPLLGVVVLAFFAGGVPNLVNTYRAFVIKAPQFSFAILTGDGPWYRYLVDLLLVSPVVLILAFGALFQLDRTKKPELFIAIFIAASYLVMCNIKYGMNLRYANMWDMPLRFLALSLLVTLFAPVRRYRNILLGAAVILICLVELRQYIILAVHFPLYEPVSEALLRALNILKYP